MGMVFKLLMYVTLFFLSACNSGSLSGYEKVNAVVTAPNGNLYVLTETLDYEFPESKAKDVKLFFELAPVFLEAGQPISARMWVKERSVDFSFDDAILKIYKEDNYKFARNESSIKDVYFRNNKAKQLLKILEKIVKKDRSGRLALKRENIEENVVDYVFKVNSKMKNNKTRGKIIEVSNRRDIIKEYQAQTVSDILKGYRINIFYEPSIIEKGIFSRKINKEALLSRESITVQSWKKILPPAVK